MSHLFSVCGTDCTDCTHFKDSSYRGFSQIKGRVWWAQYVNADACLIYDCVTKKSIDNCGSCPEIPCDFWRDLKDPIYTDEQHERSIEDRVQRLTGGS